MESATKIRQSGLVLASSRPVINRSAITESEPSFFVKKADLAKSFRVKANKSASSTTNLSASNAAAAS